MSFFVIVVTHDLTYVCLLCFVVTDFRLIDSGGQGEIPLGFVLLFFLSFLALSEGSESWVEVGTKTLALDLSPQ